MNVGEIKKRLSEARRYGALNEVSELHHDVREYMKFSDYDWLIAEVEKLEGLLKECHEKFNGVPGWLGTNYQKSLDARILNAIGGDKP